MKQSDIPFYNDPDGFTDESKYPCSTQFMVYDGQRHQYFLTEEGLNFYGLDVERKYAFAGNNKTRHFIELVAKKIYDTINYLCGFACYAVQQYRIATVPKYLYQDKYTFRKTFEQVLVAEGQWILDNGDSARYLHTSIENTKGEKPEERWRNLSDISPEALRTLEGLGLTKWFTLTPNILLDTNKY